MENATDIINTLSGVWNQITSAPAHLLLVLLLNVIGLALKKAPFIRNEWIPCIVLTLGTVLYPLLVSPTLEQHQQFRHPLLVLVIYGFLLGAMALVLHRMLLKKFGKFINGLFADDPDQPKTP